MDDPDPEPSSAFTVLKQKLEFDFNFPTRSIKGKATLQVLPQDRKARVIQLNCRQLNITSVRVEGCDATKDICYANLYERLSLYPTTGIYQHHLVKMRLQQHASGARAELEITLPDAVKVRTMRPDEVVTYQDLFANGYSADGDMFKPLSVEIEYTLENPRDAIHFVGVEDGDARYPHVLTRNSPFAGMASCLFPCTDDGTSKCLFEVSVRYPRTLGHVFGKARSSAVGADTSLRADDSPKADSVMSDVDDDPAEFTEEEKALEMSVVCSGEMTDDILDPTDPTRKTASFTCTVPVLPQHIGIVIGPFQHVDLSEFRDAQDDERLGSNAIRVHAFCLPGKVDEVRNSAMILARTLDNFTERYQSYPFEKNYKLAFVDDLDCDVAHSASFSICSSRLLFPETVWEPLENTTRVLVHAVASQWIGINVIPQRANDHWIIVGGSWFMTELYLRELFGRNDHRYRQKQAVDKVLQMDVRRPSLFLLGDYLTVDPGEAEFMITKAPLVLAILHHRLVKQSGKNGVDRCLYRLLFNTRNEKLPNGIITTEGFLDICEKVGHQKLDTFFNQWIYGSGCPTFECHPVFNKKKQVIQLTIKQTQADPSIRTQDAGVVAEDFLREAKEKLNGFRPSTEWPAFVGPMTIRIHEANGTPYEHIVEINSSTVKVEIPYNTKYKRLNKNKREKERAAAAQGLDAAGEAQEDVVIYTLGDLFNSEEDHRAWKISEWSSEDYTRMDQEFYEWIRVDADFEWICRANIIDMPAYMYVSQLQQDKDVIAQAESIQWLALKEGHPLISSILVKTLMDHRYFHGIRTMAAEVMAHSAKESLDWIGLFHLKKAFQELFCIPGSPMTRSNNFSDRSQYLIQCAIPKAIAQIKSVDGRAPMEVKRFLLDAMRYNDNRGNDYSDDHYLATLMSCLAQSLVIRKKSAADHAPELSMTDEAEQTDFERKALEELGRHQRLDEWIPTYQNIYTTTALDCALELQRHRVSPLKTSEFLQYTRISNADNVRIKAWNCLIHLGSLRKDSIIKYIIHDIQTDPSPYFRSALLRIVEFALGQMALGDDFKPEKVSDPSSVLDVDMGEEQSARENALSRRKLDGALRALKLDLTGNEALKSSLENALRSKTTSVRDVADLLEICTILYIPKSEMKIVCKMPKAWRIHHLGNGKLRFYQPGHYRWKLPKRLESLPALQAVAPTAQAVPPPPPPITLIPLNVPAQKPKLSISLGKKKTLDMNATTTPTSAPERKQSTVLPPKPPTPAPVPEAKRPTLIVPPQPKSASPATTPAARATPIPSPTQTPVPLPSAPIQAPPKRPTPTPAPTQAQPKRPTPAPPSGPPTPAPTSQPPPSRAPSRTPSERTTVTAQKQFLVSLKLPPSKLAKWPHEPTRTSKPSNTAPQKLKLNFGAAKRKAENIGDAGERDLKRQQSIVALNGKAETNGVHGFQAESRDASASANTSARSTPAPPSGPTAPVSGKPRMILKFKFRDGRAPPWLKRNGK